MDARRDLEITPLLIQLPSSGVADGIVLFERVLWQAILYRRDF